MLKATHQPSLVVSRQKTDPESSLVCSNWTIECESCPTHDLFFPSDAFRKNAFQVIAVDGVCSGVIQFPTAEDCLDWLQAIAGNISSLTKHNVSMTQPHLSLFATSRGASLRPAARADLQHIGRGAEAAEVPACEILGPGDKQTRSDVFSHRE